MTMILQTIVPRLIDVLLGLPPDTEDREAAVAMVTAFADDATEPGAWTGVEKATYCGRLAELVRAPHELNQARTFFCAPAAALYIFAQHYPKRFADFGIRLFRSGETRIGSRTITMSSGIRATNITQWITDARWAINVTDLLLILAVQEDMTFFDIDDIDGYALAPPFLASAYGSDIEGTLGNSGLFETDTITATAQGIRDEQMPEGSNVVVVGNMSVFSEKWDGRHAAVLAPPITIEDGSVTFHFWSWGTYENDNTFPVVGGRFRTHTMPVSAFNARVDMAVRVTKNGSDAI